MAFTKHLLATAIAASIALFIVEGDALAQEGEKPSTVAMTANQGLNLGVVPLLVLPQRDGGPWGGAIVLDGRYGIRTGPMVVAPGARGTGFYFSERFAGTVMGTLRVTLPVGALAPYVLGGVGAGYLSHPSDGGVALMGGGGLMVHIGRVVGFGLEATYQAVTATELHSLTLGPTVQFGG